MKKEEVEAGPARAASSFHSSSNAVSQPWDKRWATPPLRQLHDLAVLDNFSLSRIF